MNYPALTDGHPYLAVRISCFFQETYYTHPQRKVSSMSVNVPLISPIFSYKVEGGKIKVYVFRSEAETFFLVTLDEGTEDPYAVESLSVMRVAPAEYLIEKAKEAFEWVNKLVNPFEDLLRDKEALKKLQAVIEKYVVW